VITFDPDGLAARAAELEREMGEPGFWDDQQHAAAVSTEHSRITRRLERYGRLQGEYEDAAELAAMDGDMADEIAASLTPLRDELERLEEDALFTGEYDAGDAVVTIHAGTGGTDAQDWAEILLRMYLRWTQHRGFETELIEASPGEEAGLKSATFTVRGENAYGLF
jgi:peptide chain release factor 2